jgi:MarR family transcriptional regulator for hemolysin
MDRLVMEKQFATQFALLSRGWRLLGDQALSRLGVSNAGGWCLIYMQRLGSDARQSDLARAVGVREPTLVRTLHGLEKSGLIDRVPHPQDARAKVTRLTAKGSEVVREVEESLRQLRSELLAEVSDSELATALRVHGKISHALAKGRD